MQVFVFFKQFTIQFLQYKHTCTNRPATNTFSQNRIFYILIDNVPTTLLLSLDYPLNILQYNFTVQIHTVPPLCLIPATYKLPYFHSLFYAVTTTHIICPFVSLCFPLTLTIHTENFFAFTTTV